MKELKIADFKKQVEEYFNKNFPFWIKNSRKTIRQQYLSLFGSVKNKKILDVGCGLGFDARLLSAKGASGVGVDISQESIDYSNNSKIKNWVFQKGDSEKIKLGEFDFVLSSMEIMYHLKISSAFRNYSKHCKKKGKFLLVTNNPHLIAMQYNLNYEEEVLYKHEFISEIPQHNKMHRSLSKIVSTAENSGFRLDSLREIFIKNNDGKVFEQKNKINMPDFLALLFEKNK